MKRLSDYKDEEAIDLVADLLDPVATVIKGIAECKKDCNTNVELARNLLKNHKAETIEILQRIDDTPITAVNIIGRVVSFLIDIQEDKELLYFFNSVAQETDKSSSGAHTENTQE